MFRLSFLKKRHKNSSGEGHWDSLISVRTNKKTGSLRHTGQQHAGSNTTQGATHVFRVGFVLQPTLALVGLHKYEDVIHTDCKHQKWDNLRRKQVSC